MTSISFSRNEKFHSIFCKKPTGKRGLSPITRALDHAVAKRRPPPGLIFHTDRGIEYYAHAFRARLGQLNMTQSMNRPGKVTDNAFMESFFHSMKAEVIHGCKFSEDNEMLSVIRSYIPFYNRSRIHSSLNYVPPATYEIQFA